MTISMHSPDDEPQGFEPLGMDALNPGAFVDDDDGYDDDGYDDGDVYDGDDDDGDVYDYDDVYDDDGYSRGWNDGYDFALSRFSPWTLWKMRQQSRLRHLKFMLWWKWQRLKWRVFPLDDSDIPF